MLSLLALTALAAATEYIGKAASVLDGDTIHIRHHDGDLKGPAGVD